LLLTNFSSILTNSPELLVDFLYVVPIRLFAVALSLCPTVQDTLIRSPFVQDFGDVLVLTVSIAKMFSLNFWLKMTHPHFNGQQFAFLLTQPTHTHAHCFQLVHPRRQNRSASFFVKLIKWALSVNIHEIKVELWIALQQGVDWIRNEMRLTICTREISLEHTRV